MRALASVAMIAALAACNFTPTPADARNGAVRTDLYQCEGCEGALERDAQTLTAHSRIGPENEPGEPLRVHGTVYLPDGRTPAANAVIYAYQTNSHGLYAHGSSESEWSRRHGRLRGWAKTGDNGRYSFRTVKPAPYSNDTMPAHIHFTVLEPGRRPYWIDDIVFEGEFGVTAAYRSERTNKGGNGIVPLERTDDGSLEVRRDIILERHPS